MAQAELPINGADPAKPDAISSPCTSAAVL